MKKTIQWLVMLSFAVLLVACGQAQKEEAAPQPQPQPAQPEAPKAEASQPITIDHVLGTVELEKAPERIVALEFTYVEDLLALDVQPVGVADVEGYKKWVQIDKELSADVVDVGTRQEPNLEVIAQLKPDLIIAPKFRHEQIKDKLEAIAPTVFFEPYPQDESINQYDEMVGTFNTIAKAVGKEDKAEEVLNAMSQKFEEAKAKLDGAGLATKDFVLTQAYSSSQVPVLRVFTPNAMASVILEQIGLTNAFKSEKFEMYGFAQVNIEALPAVEHANFIYVVQDDDNVFENQLKENTVWKNLAFVKENRTYALGGDAWLFGGPLSAITLVDRVTDVMVKQ
jgi:ABC-type Fe3+-hydroxamate transport system substrate-binding protein